MPVIYTKCVGTLKTCRCGKSKFLKSLSTEDSSHWVMRSGDKKIYETGRIQEAACWAHVRRRFYDLQAAHKSPAAVAAIERIAGLYAIESEIRGRSPEERREIRDLRSRPLLDPLKQWLEETLGKLSRKSDTALAVRYALGRWEALLRYCDNGRLEIDNNAAERALRVVALGRTFFSPARMVVEKVPQPCTA